RGDDVVVGRAVGDGGVGVLGGGDRCGAADRLLREVDAALQRPVDVVADRVLGGAGLPGQLDDAVAARRGERGGGLGRLGVRCLRDRADRLVRGAGLV